MQQLFETAKTLMPGGVNSPVRAFRSVGGTRVFTKKEKERIFGTKMVMNILIIAARDLLF